MTREAGNIMKGERMSRRAEPNLAPTSAVRQHVVPKMYLKRFVEDDGKLQVFDHQRTMQFAAGLDAVAVRRGYYDVQLGSEQYSLETWLGNVESAADSVLDRLVLDPRQMFDLSVEDELSLARFLGVLYFRTPEYRAWLDNIVSDMQRQAHEIAKGMARSQGLPEPAPMKLKPTDARDVAAMLEETQGWANLLLSRPWRVGRVPPNQILYLSDNPMHARWAFPLSDVPMDQIRNLIGWDYYVPLSKDTLLRVQGHRMYEPERGPRGLRECRDFSLWETSFAKNVVASSSNRFMYGTGPYQLPESARAQLQMHRAKLKEWLQKQVWRTPDQ